MMPTNILYLHETSQIAGAENSLLNLAKNINRSQFNPIFLLPQEGPLSRELKKIGVEVITMPLPSIRKILGVRATLSKILSIVKEKKINLIHSNSIRMHIYAAMAAKLSKIPVVWHQRNLLIKEIIDPDRLFSFLADRIICNSYAIAKRFLKQGKLPGKVRVVYNGVNTQDFNPGLSAKVIKQELAIMPDEVVVGISSRFNINKGHETFLLAAKKLIQEIPDSRLKFRFLIVGGSIFEPDRHREKYLQGMVRELGLKEKVIFSGFRQDMSKMYAAMDIFVLTSYFEACGRVILEAMASGKPVVATNSGGTPEIIEDGINGLLFKPGDDRSLADKIAFLANNTAIAKKLGESARKRMEEHFKIEKNVSMIEEIYLELLQNS